jgi:hypothetical protein
MRVFLPWAEHVDAMRTSDAAGTHLVVTYDSALEESQGLLLL